MDPASTRQDPTRPGPRPDPARPRPDRARRPAWISARVSSAAPPPAHAIVAFWRRPAAPFEYGSATMPIDFFEYSIATASVSAPMIANLLPGPASLGASSAAAPPAAIADPPANAKG